MPPRRGGRRSGAAAAAGKGKETAEEQGGAREAEGDGEAQQSPPQSPPLSPRAPGTWIEAAADTVDAARTKVRGKGAEASAASRHLERKKNKKPRRLASRGAVALRSDPERALFAAVDREAGNPSF